MAATISAAYSALLTVTQTMTGEFIGSDETFTVDGLNATATLNASSTPPATKQASGTQAMTAGAATLDLTALPGDTADETKDMTGLKLQLAILKAPSTNANPITISQGASNAYGLDAAGGTWSLTLDPGQFVLLYLDDNAEDVAAGAKEIDLAGTAAQELDYLLVFG
jgi:hypothetical protein